MKDKEYQFKIFEMEREAKEEPLMNEFYVGRKATYKVVIRDLKFLIKA